MRIDGGRWPLRLSLLCWEMVTTFLNTLKDPYYARLIGPTSSSFADLVIVGDRIEDGIKSGRLVYTHLLQTIVEQQSGAGTSQRRPPPKRDSSQGQTVYVRPVASQSHTRPLQQAPQPNFSFPVPWQVLQ